MQWAVPTVIEAEQPTQRIAFCILPTAYCFILDCFASFVITPALAKTRRRLRRPRDFAARAIPRTTRPKSSKLDANNHERTIALSMSTDWQGATVAPRE
jgi:hypothetical protein